MRRMTPRASIHVFVLLALLAVGVCRPPESTQVAERTVTVYVSSDRVFPEPVLRA